MINDLVRLSGEVTNLIKGRELEKAALLAADALRSERASSLVSRQAAVHEATLALAELRRQRERLHAVVAALPEAEQAFAQSQIEQVCQQLFDTQIAALQSRKRELSRPVRR